VQMAICETREETLIIERDRRVTYQLAMCGMDGIVVASDLCERLVSASGEYGVPQLVKKIRINETGQFAWMHSGGQISAIQARLFARALSEINEEIAEDEVLRKLQNCAMPAIEQWRTTVAKGAEGYNRIILVCGKSKRIYREMCSGVEEPVEVLGGFCVSGQEFNSAVFLPRRLYNSELKVDVLLRLAAYSVPCAHDIHTGDVDGLQIAVCRDNGQFQFIPPEPYWDYTPVLDSQILAFLSDSPSTQL
jgi:hypothetical protein